MRHTSTAGPWVELHCTLPLVWADPVSEWLLEEKTSGVVVEEPYGSPVEPTDRVVLITAFPGETDIESVIRKLRLLGRELATRSGIDAALTVETRLIKPEKLASFLAPSFQPLELLKDLWVVPSEGEGATALIPPGARTIELIPALAFGTGRHPSTRLAARMAQSWLSRPSRPPNPRVLDFGTGSGLLAIAAVLLGAAWAVGVEKDRLAVENARRNVELNGLARRVSLVAADLKALRAAPWADLLIANLDRDHFLIGSEGLTRWLAPGGAMVVSGVLLEHEEPVLDGLQSAGLSVIERATDETWVAFTVERG